MTSEHRGRKENTRQKLSGRATGFANCGLAHWKSKWENESEASFTSPGSAAPKTPNRARTVPVAGFPRIITTTP